MDVYIPDVLLDDLERSAKMRARRVERGERESISVPVHVNVLLGLIHIYREARKTELQKRERK